MREERLVILHGIGPDREHPIEDLENLAVAEGIARILARSGRHARLVCAGLDLTGLRKILMEEPPDLVINLVEGLDGLDRLALAVPALLEALAIPYTGNPPHVLALADDKLALKEVLREAGIPTPPTSAPHGPFLVKARHQHASLGLDPGAVVRTSTEAEALIHERSHLYGTPFFAEAYIEGREFNLSVIEDPPGAARVLPPAEIRFLDWPEGTPKIVDHAAKWDDHSSRYTRTVRTFPPAGGTDQGLLEILSACALRLFAVLGLRGYARVDFRIDPDGVPYVIDLNPNPTLDPEAGFAQAGREAGVDYPTLIERILASASAARTGSRSPSPQANRTWPA